MSVHSWQQIVDEDMLKPKNVSHMVIYQKDSKALLACSPGYWLPCQDIDQCLDVFANPEHYLINGITMFKSIPEVTLAFLVIKADERSWYAKRGATSCFAAQSQRILLVAWSEGEVMPGQTANAVEKLVDFLIEKSL